MDFYCNQKFKNLQVHLERQEINSCNSAKCQKIDLKWFKDNNNDLFNSPYIVADREKMLDNIPVESCNVCWEAESNKRISKRIMKNGEQKNLTNLLCAPREISIILDTACNLTCSYCCKEYSSAWLRDIHNNGTYFDNDVRHEIKPFDKLLIKAGHKIIQNNKDYKLLLDSVLNYKDVDFIDIIGGEPFLNANLVNVVNTITSKKIIYSGLGVNNQRFTNIIKQLNKENLTITVSCENIFDFYEFNRYGNTFNNFLKNLDTIKNYEIKFNFNSVLSNLTIFGFKDFINYFNNEEIFIDVCNEPSYLNPTLIDDKSKQIILNTDYGIYTKKVHDLVSPLYDKTQKQFANIFLSKFSERRKLNLEIFPTHFLEWLKND